jgi:hypothetical protein
MRLDQEGVFAPAGAFEQLGRHPPARRGLAPLIRRPWHRI